MKFVAFLRGMNLGKRRITNEELLEHFEALGFAGASAFLASGNIVFDGRGTVERIAERISSGLAERLGYSVPTFVRTAARVREIAALDPFPRVRHGDGKLQVAMLVAPPKPAAVRRALLCASDDDLLACDGAEVFWWPRVRLTDSELDLAELERALGSMTIRTIGTIQRLSKKLAG
ncbi:MAG: DUF1697 domain-containing protein [Planctomycetes bacterium]|nr:DUF1697 domain-containing protein [Planctomycetota bacterium]